MAQKLTKKSAIRNVLISALVILFFLSVISAYYYMVYTETKKEIIKSCEISSISSSAQIDKCLSGGIDALKLVSYTLDNMLRAGKTQDEILEFMVNQSTALGYSNAAITTGVYGYIRGEYLDGTGWVPEDDYVPAEREWYIDARAHVGSVAVVDPYVDAMTGTVIITFCKTLCDAKSVISMDFSTDLVQEITADVIEESEADMEIVLDPKYQVIAHSNSTEIGKTYLQETDTFGRALVDALRSNDTGVFTMKYEKSSFIVYTTTVANDWYCLSVFDTTKIFNQLQNTLFLTILVSVIVVAVLLSLMINSGRKQRAFERLSNVVGALAESIDAKDSYTKGHSGRVADYAKEISRRHGDSEKEQENIHMMGLLHDVGKIGIPDAVINKPGKLTDDEYKLIKTHPEIGSRILSKATDMVDTLDGIRWHHERYDGKGYPDGLSGQDIPERARIIAVADTYDAMTSRRSYRDALDQDVVRKEIEDGKGTQFDPEFADIMLQMIDEDSNYDMRSK